MFQKTRVGLEDQLAIAFDISLNMCNQYTITSLQLACEAARPNAMMLNGDREIGCGKSEVRCYLSASYTCGM